MRKVINQIREQIQSFFVDEFKRDLQKLRNIYLSHLSSFHHLNSKISTYYFSSGNEVLDESNWNIIDLG